MKYLNRKLLIRDLQNTSIPIRNKRILEMRFGLFGGETASLEEVGQGFGISRERVRQLEVKTFEMLGGVAKYLTKVQEKRKIEVEGITPKRSNKNNKVKAK